MIARNNVELADQLAAAPRRKLLDPDWLAGPDGLAALAAVVP